MYAYIYKQSECIYIQINNLHRNANDLNTVSVRSSKSKDFARKSYLRFQNKISK